MNFYWIMCVLGTVLPYYFLVQWGVENGGLDAGLMVQEIAASRVSSLAWADVLVSAVVLIHFIRIEGRRMTVPNLWIPILGTCIVGVSLGLPLFLAMREIERKKEKAAAPIET